MSDTQLLSSQLVDTLDHRPREVTEFITTLDAVEPRGVTACPGRTAHLLGAHMAGSFNEMAAHVEAVLRGNPLTRSRTFDERELEFRAMRPSALVAAIDKGEKRLRGRVKDLLSTQGDSTLMWTNRLVRASGFLKHGRNECAIHRWDMVGDDQVSLELLSQRELLEHVLTFIGAGPMTARGLATGAGRGKRFSARLRAAGQPDLIVSVDDDVAAFGTADPGGEAFLESDPAARILLLWGRRATPFNRVKCNGSGEDLQRLQWILAGY